MTSVPLLSRKIVQILPNENALGRTVSILQWNVLADNLSDAFPLVDSAVLKWEHRSKLILSEILSLDPDIICLQEVDHFYDDFEPMLKTYKYTGIFKRKKESDEKSDGCALFYKDSLFVLRIRQDLEYRQHLLDEEKVNQIAILAIFDFAEPSMTVGPVEPALCVLTTHLKAKDDFEDVRVKEIAVVTKVLHQVQQQYQNIPILISADMNTEPTGPVYQFLSKGELAHTDGLTHCLSLKSAYSHHDNQGDADFYKNGEPRFTTWKIRPPHEACRVIDYIWYSDRLKLQSLLKIPDERQVPHPRLPSENFPSDHLNLFAKFQLI